jgi:hypothetical protein
VYEDFTWDPNDTMSGAADDWAYEHLGVFGWTTEFWDVVQAATGTKQSTHFWYTGPDDAERLAVLRWCDEHHPDGHVDWYEFDHPQLGHVELGGWDDLSVWTNPPTGRLLHEVAPHARFAIHQASCSPLLEIPHTSVTALGGDTWRLEVGIANSGWLPTYVTDRARRENLVRPIVADLEGDEVDTVGQPRRQTAGQLEGRASMRFRGGNDGTPDRALIQWTVRGAAGAAVDAVVRHDRAGEVRARLVLG